MVRSLRLVVLFLLVILGAWPTLATAQPVAYTDTPAVLDLSAVTEMQTPPQFTLGTPLHIRWNGAANETASATNAYQVAIDADTNFVPTGVSVPLPEYTWPIPQARLTLGAHTIRVRACSGATCGPSLDVAFEITRPLPGMPRNGVVEPVPGQASISIPQAIEYVQAYALWAIDRRLTDGELGFVAGYHTAPIPTKASVALALEAVYPALAR